MLTLLLGWILMGGVLLAIIRGVPGPSAFAWWAVFTAAACALGAFAIARQPVGESTVVGRFGSSVVHWGWRVGHGKLWPPIVISCGLWTLVGIAVMAIVRHRGDVVQQLLVVAWVVDIVAVLYLLGVGLVNRSTAGSFPVALLGVVGALMVMLSVSGISASNGSSSARRFALLVAGGPPLFVGLGYGLFLLVMVTLGRNARWN